MEHNTKKAVLTLPQDTDINLLPSDFREELNQLLEVSRQNHDRKPRFTFGASVRFGSPADKCLGHGICKIGHIFDNNKPDFGTCCTALAIIEISSGSSTKLRIFKSSVSSTLIERQFHNNWFRAESDFIQDINTGSTDSIANIIIKTGWYRIKENQNSFEITFPCIL